MHEMQCGTRLATGDYFHFDIFNTFGVTHIFYFRSDIRVAKFDLNCIMPVHFFRDNII